MAERGQLDDQGFHVTTKAFVLDGVICVLGLASGDNILFCISELA